MRARTPWPMPVSPGGVRLLTLSRVRVRAVVDRPQAGQRDPGVLLGGGQAGVAENLLPELDDGKRLGLCSSLRHRSGVPSASAKLWTDSRRAGGSALSRWEMM